MNFERYFTDFQDKATREIVHIVKEKIAPSDYPVIIKGASGSGKDFFAYLIHSSSLRRDKPFVRIDCPNVIEQLAGSELLGHERGAYTDAGEQKKGRMEMAGNGTLYFDRLDQLSLASQNILFSVLERKSFTRLGGTEVLSFRARVIVSCQIDLRERIREKKFKSELYYLLDKGEIVIPPLKERRADILPLVNYFLKKSSLELGLPLKKLSPEAERWCRTFSWPGNIRQVKNAIEKIYLSTSAPQITEQDLLFLMEGEKDIIEEAAQRHSTLKEMEDLYIGYILRHTRGNKTKAAEILGVSRKTLIERLKKS